MQIVSFDEALKELQTNENLRKKYDDALHAEFEYGEGKFNFVTTLHMKVLACDHMMQASSFEYSLRKLASQKHWDIVDERVPGSDAKLGLKNGNSETQETYLRLLRPTVDLEGDWEAIERRTKSQL